MTKNNFVAKIMSIFLSITLVATLFFNGLIQIPRVSAKDGIPNQDITNILSDVIVNITHTDSGKVCVDNNKTDWSVINMFENTRCKVKNG
jgi:hypothetical protein